MTLSNILSLLPYGLVGIVSLIALVYKSKAISSATTSVQATTAAADAPLVAQQAADEQQVKTIDSQIDATMAAHQAELDKSNKQTDQQKADSWNTPKPS